MTSPNTDQKLVFVFDLDDTVVDAFPHFCDLAKQFDANADLSTFASRASHEYLNITLDEWLAAIAASTIFLDAEPKPGMGFLDTLYSQGHQIHFVTSRGFSAAAHEQSKQWLETWGIEFTSLHVLPLYDCKADYILRTFGKVDYFFDDTLEHCGAVLEKGAAHNVVLINAIWNRHVEVEFQRIENLSEFPWSFDNHEY